MVSLSTVWLWLDMLQRELVLFAAVWVAIGAFDEWGMDGLWAWLRITGRARTIYLSQARVASADWPAQTGHEHDARLRGVAAVLVPAWSEAEVVGAMLAHCLAVWPHGDLRVYLGCYRNDPATLAAAMQCAHDPRLRIVVHDRDGPTTKADCLNRLYAALLADEARTGLKVRSVIVHDAADMVHPNALDLLDRALDHADFVALPVQPEVQPHSRWIAGHYGEEFAELQTKGMVVRSWLGGGLPTAGVGCAIARHAIALLAARSQGGGPFAADSLTENYEFGLAIAEIGGKAQFLRARDASGALVATRKYFPAQIDCVLRQKTRWLHGVALQGWDRMGWGGSLPELWMRLRDRRGPMAALVLLTVYVLLALTPLLALARSSGRVPPFALTPAVRDLLMFDGVALAWRAALCGVFTAREYGLAEAGRALLRMPVRHAIAIVAARRAVFAYLATLQGGTVIWEHTAHCALPVRTAPARAARHRVGRERGAPESVVPA